jgi:SagB-type dehydrogenase family enzyme
MRERFRLRRDAALHGEKPADMGLRLGHHEIAFAGLDPAGRMLLLRLADGWVATDSLDRLPGERSAQPLHSRAILLRLLSMSLLDHRWEMPARPLLEVLPRPARLGPTLRTARTTRLPARCRLSRFVVLHADAEGFVARSPLSTTTLRVLDPKALQVLCDTADVDRTPAELTERLDLDPGNARRILIELVAAHILVPDRVRDAEQQRPYLFWSVEELALHDRSRPGRHALPLGGTRRFVDRVDSAPLAHRPPSLRTVELAQPDPGPAAGRTSTLTELLAARRSIRRQDPDHPITLNQLADFLHRVQHTEPAGTAYGQELGRRPYPTGGGVCELEVYPAVWNCRGLARGLYHYDGMAHRLELLGDDPGRLSAVLDYARASLGVDELPQVLLTITTRITRLLWRYEGMGYAMTLKHAGVLTELMYLVATEMRLAPCAVGGGDAGAFAQLSGLDPIEEPSIAEFALGSVGS